MILIAIILNKNKIMNSGFIFFEKLMEQNLIEIYPFILNHQIFLKTLMELFLKSS